MKLKKVRKANCYTQYQSTFYTYKLIDETDYSLTIEATPIKYTYDYSDNVYEQKPIQETFQFNSSSNGKAYLKELLNLKESE